MEIFIILTKYNTIGLKKVNHCSWSLLSQHIHPLTIGGSSCGVIVKAMDCRIVVNEFELQSHDHIHFWTNTLGKGMNPLILAARVNWYHYSSSRWLVGFYGISTFVGYLTPNTFLCK